MSSYPTTIVCCLLLLCGSRSFRLFNSRRRCPLSPPPIARPGLLFVSISVSPPLSLSLTVYACPCVGGHTRASAGRGERVDPTRTKQPTNQPNDASVKTTVDTWYDVCTREPCLKSALVPPSLRPRWPRPLPSRQRSTNSSCHRSWHMYAPALWSVSHCPPPVVRPCVCVCVCRTRVAPRAARSSQRGKTRGEGKQIRLLPTLPTERAASSVFKVACTANSSYILGVYVSVAVERYEIERERKEKEAEQESGAGGSFKAERARRGRRAWIERGGRQTRSSLEEPRGRDRELLYFCFPRRAAIRRC